jgi:SAM-dependent methyltransferase
MTFDPQAYKRALTQEWGRAAQGWHDWIPKINDWLYSATEIMLDEAEIQLGSRVIDIAAGDGGQSVAAASRVGITGEVLATDIAPEFIKLARAVASRLDIPQLRAQVMDAEALTVPDKSFDAAISRLGLMYLPDLKKGLSEIHRTLRPGGRVSVTVFTTAQKTPFFSVPVSLIRQRRGLPGPEPGQPGPFSLGVPGMLAGRLTEVGFDDVSEQIVDAPIRFASAEECVRWRREVSGTLQAMLRGLDENEKEAIWKDITNALREFETGEGFESPCELLICSARRTV